MYFLKCALACFFGYLKRLGQSFMKGLRGEDYEPQDRKEKP